MWIDTKGEYMIERINPLCLIDFYKADHRRQYPIGTEYVYSNWTPRMSRIFGVKDVVFFGLQYFIKEYLMHRFQKYFFDLPKEKVVADYKRRMDTSLGNGAIPVDHIEALHDLGYLPIEIKALPEGTRVPLRTPMLTIINTLPEFFWLTNYLETLMSSILWKPCTSATIANVYRETFERYCDITGYDESFIQWQGHDFSCRGMSGMEDAMMSGAGHLLSFTGTDTVCAIDFLEMFYNANTEKELVGSSVSATEHSVMCMGGDVGEFYTFKRLITELYPNGIVSIVSDTWDFWAVITDYLPRLKNEIMNRNGRVTIRPDSGTPELIICGDPDSDVEHIRKGAYECLWDTFGGTKNEKGYKELHPSIGLIYGDSITMERQEEILERLEAKGFSASNLVLGIGSFTYEYVTRDTFGFAMKATWGKVNGENKDIFKSPKTDTGFKRSARGLIRVNEDLTYTDMCSEEEEKTGLLKTVYKDGKLLIDQSLAEIRERVKEQRP